MTEAPTAEASSRVGSSTVVVVGAEVVGGVLVAEGLSTEPELVDGVAPDSETATAGAALAVPSVLVETIAPEVTATASNAAAEYHRQ